MAKEFTYRGKSIEELKKLDVREFAKFLPSKTRRAVLRQFDTIERFVKSCEKKQERGKQIRTHARETIIVPKMVGLTIFVHNGKTFVKVNIMPKMIGHRLGEFVPTRGKVQHGAPGIGATRSSAAMSVK